MALSNGWLIGVDVFCGGAAHHDERADLRDGRLRDTGLREVACRCVRPSRDDLLRRGRADARQIHELLFGRRIQIDGTA